MSDANNLDALKQELASLRSQIENLIKSAEGKKSEISSEVIDKLTREFENLRKSAGNQAQKLYESGQAGMDEAEAYVRRNPLLSLGVAFGAGFLMSCLLKHLR